MYRLVGNAFLLSNSFNLCGIVPFVTKNTSGLGFVWSSCFESLGRAPLIYKPIHEALYNIFDSQVVTSCLLDGGLYRFEHAEGDNQVAQLTFLKKHITKGGILVTASDDMEEGYRLLLAFKKNPYPSEAIFTIHPYTQQEDIIKTFMNNGLFRELYSDHLPKK